MRKADNPNYSNGTGTKENIRAIEQDIERHQASLNELYHKIDGIGRANWQIILSAIGVFVVLMAGLWGLAVLPINADVQKTARDLKYLEGVVAQRGIVFEGNRVKLEVAEAMIARFRDNLSRIETNFLTTKEFKAASDIYMTRHNELQNQLIALNRKVDEVFPPQKTLEDLTRRLAELERTRVIGPPPKP